MSTEQASPPPETADDQGEELVSCTQWSYDPERIAADFAPFADLPLRHHALAVTSRPGSSDPMYEGADAPIRRPAEEMAFNVINEPFRGTVFEEILLGLPFPFGRTRIMCIPPQRCYPVHCDQTIRYHIALRTHPYSYLMYPYSAKVYHIPDDGHIYRVDAREPHTAVNASWVPRFHLVIVTDQEGD